jgi:hypothetical protein
VLEEGLEEHTDPQSLVPEEGLEEHTDPQSLLEEVLEEGRNGLARLEDSTVVAPVQTRRTPNKA